MYVAPPSLAAAKKGGTPYYYCEQKTGSRQGTTHNHNTTIHLPLADKAAWEKVCQTLENPLEVRAAIEERRRENKRVANPQEVTESLCNIEKEMENLFELARHATNDSTRTRLGLFMEELEKQKQQAESFLHDIEDDESGREEIEAEIARFEKWVSDVRPRLINPESQADIPYEEKRLAIRVLGIRMTVYPVNGSYPFRYRLDVTVPKIMAKVRGYSSNHT